MHEPSVHPVPPTPVTGPNIDPCFWRFNGIRAALVLSKYDPVSFFFYFFRSRFALGHRGILNQMPRFGDDVLRLNAPGSVKQIDEVRKIAFAT
jgi:hypothetical protein